jgi:ketosteroid isomerase-like protein
VYHAIVARRVRAVFGHLSRGEWGPILSGLTDDVHHVFPGDNALGGERRSREAVGRWFDRLGRLFPVHEFTVHRVAPRGWPWDTWVAVEWSARLGPQEGDPYPNDGAHWIHVRWGKVDAFHAYLDTERVSAACDAMAAAGVEEAGAAPIS